MTPIATAPTASIPLADLSVADFDRVRRLILEHAGISLHDGKHAMVQGRLMRRVRATGHADIATYLRAVERHPGSGEWQSFINSLTTNLTAFFREEHHFLALAGELQTRQGRPTRIWCNAASTGEEPYSLAMTVAETLGPAAPVALICSDIDTDVLAKAKAGVYQAGARGLTPERLRRHFLRGVGHRAGLIRVRPELSRSIDFRVFNLAGDRWGELGAPMDIVFCRNVMIYFDASTQRRVLTNLHAAMTPGGLLYIGHSENLGDSRDLFRLRGKTIYERV